MLGHRRPGLRDSQRISSAPASSAAMDTIRLSVIVFLLGSKYDQESAQQGDRRAGRPGSPGNRVGWSDPILPLSRNHHVSRLRCHLGDLKPRFVRAFSTYLKVYLKVGIIKKTQRTINSIETPHIKVDSGLIPIVSKINTKIDPKIDRGNQASTRLNQATKKKVKHPGPGCTFSAWQPLQTTAPGLISVPQNGQSSIILFILAPAGIPVV